MYMERGVCVNLYVVVINPYGVCVNVYGARMLRYSKYIMYEFYVFPLVLYSYYCHIVMYIFPVKETT